MSDSSHSILLLQLPNTDDGCSQAIANSLEEQGVRHEVIEVTTERYDDILDRLAANVLPVVLKARR